MNLVRVEGECREAEEGNGSLAESARMRLILCDDGR